ncbi:hypothetical protein A3860_32475 [Niastella vici]|uniref:DUF7691 domain-containing protein n=1 Tax=Niastella vici TaxID=1703345 RepID=A0A1V9FR37_9BACT|nr:hypothetical protein [Niastella vici]OQP60716.1 hypothetical protein A3860_32475 [Niastella vici]
MGCYIFSYGIKTEEIQKVFGSNDNALLDRVQSHKTFKSYAEGIGARGLSIGLKDISTYLPGDNLDSSLDGYAFLCICASVGTQLPYRQEIKLGAGTDKISEVLTVDIQKLLVENGHFFPLSKVTEPGISLITLEELKIIKNRLSSVHITDEKMKELADMGDLDEDLRGLIENINYCVDHGLDMISFCH